MKQMEPIFFTPPTNPKDGRRTLYKGGSKGPSPEETAYANAQERAKRVQEATGQVDSVFAPQFTDDWYGKQKQGYVNYYIPELKRQYDEAKNQMTMNLASTNPYGSSSNNKQFADMERAYGDQYNNMMQSADQFASDLRTRVADARTKALQNAGDADIGTIMNQALNQAQAASAVPAFSPMADVFAKFLQPAGMAAMSQQQGGANAPAQGGVTLSSKGKSGLF